MTTRNRLIPNDATLPNLGIALDTSAMIRIFEQHFQNHMSDDVRVIACEIERIKYRPQRNCLIGYKIKFIDRDAIREHRLCAGMYAADDARSKFENALAGDHIETAMPSVSLISTLNLVIWSFPNERKLKSAPLLADNISLGRDVLPDVVRARWGEDWEILECSSAIANYFPEHSCGVNVTLTLNHTGTKERRKWEVIGKARNDDVGAQTMTLMSGLWSKGDDCVGYARPVLYQSETHILWQERVFGATLHSLLTTHTCDAGILDRVARAITSLHRSSVNPIRRVTTSMLIERLQLAKALILTACPNLADLMHRVVREMLETASALDCETQSTCHGDLHSNNILISADRTYLIDLDDVCIGPPAADLGSFLAELIYRGYLDGRSLDDSIESLRTILARYRGNVPWSVLDADVAWFCASALIHERVLRCITSLKVGGEEVIKHLLVTSLQILRMKSFHAQVKTQSTFVSPLGQAA